MLRRDRLKGKWEILANTTISTLLNTMNLSMILVALPAIFLGLNFLPFQKDAAPYVLWLISGYGIISATTVVTFGKLSDMYGRVRLYKLGYVIFILSSLALGLVYTGGTSAILALILGRMVQAIGGALLAVNGPAMLADYFPKKEIGKAMGLNQTSTIAGTVFGLLLGGILASINWRLIFLINVPIGVIGLLLSVRIRGMPRQKVGIDWKGNATFFSFVIFLLLGITYGVRSYRGAQEGWLNPLVLLSFILSIASFVLFLRAERRSKNPMMDLGLFRVSKFSSGNFSLFISSLARQGLAFILIILFQAVWLPLHDYSYASAPFWSSVYTLPFLLAFFVFGPVSGYLSDEYGSDLFVVSGLLIAALGFATLYFQPYNFSYVWFSPSLFIIGMGLGLFSSPNTANIMGTLGKKNRSMGSGIRSVVSNIAMSTSFSLYLAIILLGMGTTLHSSLSSALSAAGVPQTAIAGMARIPESEALLSAMLGYNPMSSILAGLPHGIYSQIPQSALKKITSLAFFPQVIAGSFIYGFRIMVAISTVLLIIAALLPLLAARLSKNRRMK